MLEAGRRLVIWKSPALSNIRGPFARRIPFACAQWVHLRWHRSCTVCPIAMPSFSSLSGRGHSVRVSMGAPFGSLRSCPRRYIAGGHPWAGSCPFAHGRGRPSTYEDDRSRSLTDPLPPVVCPNVSLLPCFPPTLTLVPGWGRTGSRAGSPDGFNLLLPNGDERNAGDRRRRTSPQNASGT